MLHLQADLQWLDLCDERLEELLRWEVKSNDEDAADPQRTLSQLLRVEL